MEELVIIIPALASILSIAASVMKKKKTQNFAQRKDAAYNPWENQEHSASQAYAAQSPKPLSNSPQPAAAYAPAKMGAEGTDACHDYMLDDPAPISAADEKTDEEKRQAANELVRGIILSEILQRPRMGYGRKSL